MSLAEQIQAAELEIQDKKKALLALRQQVPGVPVTDYELTNADGSKVKANLQLPE